MRMIDQNGVEITSANLSLGRLEEEKILVAHHEAVKAVKEQWHYEVAAEYPNGGRDVVKVVDVPGVEAKAAWDEFETVQRYILYTQEELEAIEQVKNIPMPLSVEERLCALENTMSAADYVSGAWYYRGDRVSFDGNIYTCIAPDGVVCVWSPAEHGAYWKA